MKQYLLGPIQGYEFMAAVFFALVGATLSLLFQANNRDVKASSTPFHFSLFFLIADNWKRMLLSLILIFAVVRFMPEITGQPLTMFWAFVAGLGLDIIAQQLKDKLKAFQVNRDNIK